MAIIKNGITLDHLAAWEAHAGPKSKDQWVDGRSAKETARTWLAAGPDSLPAEVASALERHADFGRLEAWEAEPEAKLRFDNFGEPRNSDIALVGRDAKGSVLIAVEAKADEPFSETVEATLAAALERKLKSKGSNGIARVERLAIALFESKEKGEPPLKNIRYQLLTAVAGALCEAERRDCNRALMLVQEFITSKTDDAKHASNSRDLNRFLARLSRGSVSEIKSGQIVGPFYVPGNPLLSSRIPLYVGKVSKNLREASA